MNAYAPSINFVLARTSHPGNIGAAARALKTMAQENLTLVAPQDFPSQEATARSSGATDLLERAKVVATLPEAVGEATLVFGTTVRERAEEWPIVTAREAAALAQTEIIGGGKVALVFGRENGGLLNEELACCHQLIRIPVSSDYGTLNLASAVQVIAYEMLLLNEPEVPIGPPPAERANAADIDAYLQHLNKIMDATGFSDGEKADLARYHLRRLFVRADPTLTELKLLHGILRSVGKKLSELD